MGSWREGVHGLRDAQSRVASPVATFLSSLRDWRVVGVQSVHAELLARDVCGRGWRAPGLGRVCAKDAGPRRGKGGGNGFACGVTVGAACAAAHGYEPLPRCGCLKAGSGEC